MAFFVFLNMVNKIHYLDLLARRHSDPAVPLTIIQYLKDKWNDKKKEGEMTWEQWQIDTSQTKIPQQENGYDCSIFTFLFANFMSIDKELTFTQCDVDMI